MTSPVPLVDIEIKSGAIVNNTKRGATETPAVPTGTRSAL